MFSDYFKLALRTFRHKPTRSWLTILGIFIGIAAVVALISLGQGMQEAINQQFEILGTDKITIYPGASSFGVLGSLLGSERMSDHDISIIKRISGVNIVVGVAMTIAKVVSGDEHQYTMVIGYNPDEINIKDFIGVTIIDGRELRANDGYKVMIGYSLGYEDIYEEPIEVGDTLEISGKSFTVVGIVSEVGNPGYDNRIYINRDLFYSIFTQEGYPLVVVRTKEGYDTTSVADAIKEKLRKDRNLEEGSENFTVMTSQQLQKMISDIIGVIQTIVIGIAAISLLVGGTGIMNTMYTSVLERTREIGIMKAVGAKNFDIGMVFFIESGILGLVGGVIGIVFGLSMAYAVELAATSLDISLKASFDPLIIGGALLFSFIIGSVSGIIPTLQAAKLKPAESLRYE